MTASPLLQVEGLVTHFPVARGWAGTLRRERKRAVHAVDGVSLLVQEGELVALVGESGSGKTTTALTLIRMVEPDAGTIAFQGRDLGPLSHRELKPIRRQLQMIYQDPYESLDPRFRVGRSVAEPLVAHRVGRDAGDRRARVIAALERAGLSPGESFLDRFPHELSGGQRQRVAIAAALVLEPRLLIADEPVSMLDVSVRAGILALFDELRRSGLGIIMITHDLSTAVHHADRIAVMYLGRIVEEGPAAEVVRDPVHPYTRALVSAVPDADPRRRSRPQVLQGEVPDPTAVPPGCRFHPRCPIALPSCAHEDQSLLPVDGRDERHRAACAVSVPAS